MMNPETAFTKSEIDNITWSKVHLKHLITSGNLLAGYTGANVLIAGGYFTSKLQDKAYKDIDIFILDNDHDVYNTVTRGFDKILTYGVEASTGDYMNTKPLDSMFPQGAELKKEWSRSEIMDYAHNPNIVDVINNHKTKAQYILTKYKTREELLEHFDYKHCKVSYVPVDDMLYINRETYDCIINKILKINNEQNSKNHQYRLNNFMNKGWSLADESKKRLNDLQREGILESFEKLKMEAITSAASIDTNLRNLTADKIKAGYDKIKEEMAAKQQSK